MGEARVGCLGEGGSPRGHHCWGLTMPHVYSLIPGFAAAMVKQKGFVVEELCMLDCMPSPCCLPCPRCAAGQCDRQQQEQHRPLLQRSVRNPPDTEDIGSLPVCLCPACPFPQVCGVSLTSCCRRSPLRHLSNGCRAEKLERAPTWLRSPFCSPGLHPSLHLLPARAEGNQRATCLVRLRPAGGRKRAALPLQEPPHPQNLKSPAARCHSHVPTDHHQGSRHPPPPPSGPGCSLLAVSRVKQFDRRGPGRLPSTHVVLLPGGAASGGLRHCVGAPLAAQPLHR